MTGFVKVYTTILDSSVWGLDHATRIVWITMLAMADGEGRVRASVGGLARRAVVTRDECEAALEALSSPDPDDTSGVDEGRRIRPTDGGWVVVNHRRHRDRRSEKQEADAARQRRHRARVTSVTERDIAQCHTPSQPVALEAEAEADKIPPVVPPSGGTAEQGPTRRPRRAPARALPEAWAPKPAHAAIAADLRLDVAREAQAFRDHAAAKERRQVDWDAAFRLWLRSPYAKPRAGPPQPNGGGKYFTIEDSRA